VLRIEGIKSPTYKRPLDITVLLLAHAVFLPLWVLIWITIPVMIWVFDRGPVFFRQERIGKNGKIIIIRKFRTMIIDADSKGPAWNVRNDPRVTIIGQILRRTALDEVPSLLNIWKGEMSLVGPRALDTQEQKIFESTIDGFELRLAVVPGLTGLAQVYDKHDIAQDKLRYDLDYISRMNMWLDIQILFLSVKNTLLARWDQREGKSTSPNDKS